MAGEGWGGGGVVWGGTWVQRRAPRRLTCHGAARRRAARRAPPRRADSAFSSLGEHLYTRCTQRGDSGGKALCLCSSCTLACSISGYALSPEGRPKSLRPGKCGRETLFHSSPSAPEPGRR